MQVKYNCWEQHPVSIRHAELNKQVDYRCLYKSSIIDKLSSMRPDLRKLYEEFLKDPVIEAYAGDWLRPDFRAPLHDMRGKPMKLGSLFIQNYNRRLDMFIVTSVGKTGGAHVNRLVDNGNPWSG